MAYIGKSPSSGIRNRFIYTATAGQTTFSGADDENRTLSYTDGHFTDVYLNGVKLDKSDYTATSGTSVVLDEGAAVDDILEVVAFDTFSVFNGEFSADVTVGGTLTANGNVDVTGTATFSDDVDVNGNELILDADGDTSITADTDDQIDFKTGGTDRMVIDSSGHVGIGTSSVATLGSNHYTLEIDGKNTSTAGALRLRSTDDSVDSGFWASSTATFFGTLSSHPIQFRTNNTERMRIDSSGDVGIGETSPAESLAVKRGSSGSVASFRSTYSDYSSMLVFYSAGGSIKGSVSATPSSVSYNTSSDHRLKENVVAMTGAITRVKTLKPKRFNFIGYTDATVDGFLAHEAQTVVPEAVTGTQDEVDADGNPVYQGIDQSKLVPLLTAALQEAITKIEALETENADFETRIAALEAN